MIFGKFTRELEQKIIQAHEKNYNFFLELKDELVFLHDKINSLKDKVSSLPNFSEEERLKRNVKSKEYYHAKKAKAKNTK